MLNRKLIANAAIVRVAIFLLTFAGLAPLAAADDYSRGWGPQVGTSMPLLDAADHTGVPRTLDNLSGEQGLLLFLSRSADW